MLVETFRKGALEQIYNRFHEKGRMLPEGLIYPDSWLADFDIVDIGENQRLKA